MAYTRIQIISMALTLLGKGPINSIESAGEFAAAADNAFEMLLETELSVGNWRFATTQVQLSQLVTVPTIPDWAYAFQLPTGYISVVRVYPDIDFQIYGKQLYANSGSPTAVMLEYRYMPDCGMLPSYFVAYFVHVLAKWLSLAVAQQLKYNDELRLDMADSYSKALFADAQSHPNAVVASNPFIDCRSSGTLR